MSHILSIQDLSCVGRCSLTVALPVLSAMGHRCSVLPTAVLSTHTAFPSPEVVPMTGHLAAFADHWARQGVTFDGISVGYLSDPIQAGAVLEIVDKFSCPLILDPVMGDGGRLYSRITPAHIQALKKLCARADVMLPNVTEAAYLAGEPYTDAPDELYLETLARKLLALGAGAVVITGVCWDDGRIGWYFSDGSASRAYRDEYIRRSCHGTGDLFAAVFAGNYLTDRDIPAGAEKAARFVCRCVAGTPEVTPFGVEFEKELPMLMGKQTK